MVKVLTVLAVLFLVAGLGVCAGYVGYQAVVQRANPTWPPTFAEVFYVGLAVTAIGTWTLGLLEIRRAVATSLAAGDVTGTKPPAPTPPKKLDLRTSYLDVQER